MENTLHLQQQVEKEGGDIAVSGNTEIQRLGEQNSNSMKI
jgi:hypothetical protein